MTKKKQLSKQASTLIKYIFYPVLIFIFSLQNVYAQNFTVKGTVLYNPKMNTCINLAHCDDAIKLTREEDWIPTPGAVNIIVKGTHKIAKTNPAGKYKITVASKNDTLLFLYLACNKVEVPIEGREVVDIKMTPTPLSVIDKLLGLIIPKVNEGTYPNLNKLAEEASVNKATAQFIIWLVLGNRRMSQHYPEVIIPHFQFANSDSPQL